MQGRNRNANKTDGEPCNQRNQKIRTDRSDLCFSQFSLQQADPDGENTCRKPIPKRSSEKNRKTARCENAAQQNSFKVFLLRNDLMQTLLELRYRKRVFTAASADPIQIFQTGKIRPAAEIDSSCFRKDIFSRKLNT